MTRKGYFFLVLYCTYRVLAASCSAAFELVSGGAGNQGDGQSFVSLRNVHKTIQIQN